MGCKGRFYCDIMAVHPEVTGSCNLVVVKMPNCETMKFLVDCGLFQERKYDSYNSTFPFYPENIDFCLVTHNHVDHTGRLPLLTKNGFMGGIYTSKVTSKLLPLALEDSYRVLKDVAKRENKKELYSEQDVSNTKKLIVPCRFYDEVKINEHVSVIFLKNGHLVGASLIFVKISYPEYDDINLLFTGDYNNKNMFFDVPLVPSWILEKPLTVIQESTYGYMNSDEMVKSFKENVSNFVKQGGTVIVPVFSLGRSQEILYELKCMQESGDLSKDIPIYFDGKLAIRYTRLYLSGELEIKSEMMNFFPENFNYVDKVLRAKLLNSTETKIIVTTSGMGSYGPAQTYIPAYIKRADCLIHFTGYTSEGTFGNRLKSTKHGEMVQVAGLITKKLADVEYTTEYSAHAKADEMIAFLKQFKNLKLVLVNHGQTDVKNQFAERIYEEVSPKDVGILGEDFFFRVNSWGLQKTLSTRFK